MSGRRGRRAVVALCRLFAVLMAPALIAGPAKADEAGATIATKGTPAGVPACVSCHGAQGQGNAIAGFPRLAGLPAPYLRAQLAAFASGQRANPVMMPFAKLLTPADIQAVTAYFAQLPAPALPKTIPAQTGPGAALALGGRWSEGVPACVSCHGPEGRGVGITFPPLAGQSAGYLKAQLEAWQHGTRPPGPLGLMKAVAGRLSAADIAAVTQWFGALTEGADK
ncbi:MAG: cytochrome C [Rhodospirillales bacterium 20-64-7]|nr:MAG: cytochrome C [Rhodospirillales bacterium 20-64-7]